MLLQVKLLQNIKTIGVYFMVATERIWRVKTRICNIENFSYDKKFPVLVRSDNHYTKLIVLKSHEDASHSGINTTLNFVPLNFWIITGTQTIKKS